jgi:cytochrome c oxidase subunit II
MARMVVIGVLAAIAGLLVAVLIPWLPDSASEEMDRIEFVYWFATVICIGIFALVAAVIVYSVMRFRVQPDDETDGPPIHGHTGLEIAWTVVPFVLVLAIGIVSAVVLSQNGKAGPNPLELNVYAQQFAWRFEYPNEDVRSLELVMPVDRSLKVTMTSADVIHSFWIPQMGQKQDLVPGIETSFVLTPTRTGDFTLICTELCGLGHATMRAPVRVVSQHDFDAWLAERRAATPAGGGGSSGGTGGGAGTGGGSSTPAADGSKVFAAAGCTGCHSFSPAGSDAEVGPSLDDLAAAADAAGKPEADFVRESIVDPSAYLAPGYADGVMPATFGQTLSDAEINALVTYLTEGNG